LNGELKASLAYPPYLVASPAFPIFWICDTTPYPIKIKNGRERESATQADKNLEKRVEALKIEP
jgi:hypothetical protein